jgi:hypothetical protein
MSFIQEEKLYFSDSHPNFHMFMCEQLPYNGEKKIYIELASDPFEWRSEMKSVSFNCKYLGKSYFNNRLYEIKNIIYENNGNIYENNKDKIIYNIETNVIDKNLYLEHMIDEYEDTEYFLSAIYDIFVDQLPIVISKEKQKKFLNEYILVRKIEKLWEKYWFEPYEYKIIDGKQIVYTRSIESKYKEMQKLIQ